MLLGFVMSEIKERERVGRTPAASVRRVTMMRGMVRAILRLCMSLSGK